jgi:nitronate monooxygenase
MIVSGGADDIVTSSLFTGVSGNYLRPSIEAAGLDPDNLPSADASSMNFGSGSSKPKAWKEIWGAGQGIGAVKEIGGAADLVDRIEAEYRAAGARLAAEFAQ